ncbi:MAG: hypothetical protein ACRCZ0_10845 [Cetobacterium sp.]
MAKGGKDPLDKLISNLEKVAQKLQEANPLYDKIVASVFRAIGKATAFDTGVARSLIQGVLNELGQPNMANELYPIVYEFWKSVDARLKDNPTYSINKSGGRYSVTISDYGFSNQATYGKLSENHPRSNGGLTPYQVDYANDLVESGADAVIERSLDELHRQIVMMIERGV